MLTKSAKLYRLTDKPHLPQMGVLCFDDQPFCATLELPWNDNKRSISCIPAGTYLCRKTFKRTTLGGLVIPETFEVMRVPGRSGILIHVGNYPKDTQGCILLGTSHTWDSKKPMILHSNDAFRAFLTRMQDVNELELVITNAFK